jgi:hypothetical protein
LKENNKIEEENVMSNEKETKIAERKKRVKCKRRGPLFPQARLSSHRPLLLCQPQSNTLNETFLQPVM